MATTKVTTDGIDMSGNTGALTWVKGTTAEQPSGALGEIREDTTAKRAVVYTDQTGTAEWRNLKETSTTFGVDFLVVAGGGGGGAETGRTNGGGGAGGLRTSYGSSSGGGSSNESAAQISLNTAYTLTVGAGGAINTLGENSQFATIVSIGGGPGKAVTDNSADGGSGGGGCNSSGFTDAKVGGAGTSGQGFNGGNSNPAGGGRGAGGGGAGAVGSDSLSNTGGNGGVGLEVGITGSNVFYAGGAGGAGTSTASGGTGGNGGGGDGESNNGNNATAGTANTGGGGGGAFETGAKAGGSGIVILRTTKASATLGSGITVNSTAGPGSVSGVSIGGTSDYYYSATSGSGTITFS
jgi:hypothetical protein